MLFINSWAMGQDIHFSQFYASPLSLNPSLTGNQGKWSIMNNHRRQWGVVSVPYITTSFGFDHVFYIKSQKFAGGIFILNDQSGPGHLTGTGFYLSGAYHREFGKQTILLGIQAGYMMKTIDQVTFPQQFDPVSSSFNARLPSGETGLSGELSYPDINAGIYWKHESGTWKPHGGIGIFHILQPDAGFVSSGKLPVRFNVHGGFEYALNEKLALKPELLYMYQQKANLLIGGVNAEFYMDFKSIESVWFGCFARNTLGSTDALIANAGVSIKNFLLGFSYDVNISKLNPATNFQGGIELSLLYKVPDIRLEKTAIPCDVF